MIRALIDTTTLISAFGRRWDTKRKEKARAVISFLESEPKRFSICYSVRTARELDPPIPELDRFERLDYHAMNLPWERIHANWNEIGSQWGNEREQVTGDALQQHLPSDRNESDRGILGDAIFGGCTFLLHEDSHFEHLAEHGRQNGVEVVNLLTHSAEEVIARLNSHAHR